MWLRFKIFIGYITLIALLSFTIYFFRKEQMKRNCLQQDEQELLHFWHLTAGSGHLWRDGQCVGREWPGYLSEKEKRGMRYITVLEAICACIRTTGAYRFVVPASGEKGTIA